MGITNELGKCDCQSAGDESPCVCGCRYINEGKLLFIEDEAILDSELLTTRRLDSLVVLSMPWVGMTAT